MLLFLQSKVATSSPGGSSGTGRKPGETGLSALGLTHVRSVFPELAPPVHLWSVLWIQIHEDTTLWPGFCCFTLLSWGGEQPWDDPDLVYEYPSPTWLMKGRGGQSCAPGASQVICVCPQSGQLLPVARSPGRVPVPAPKNEPTPVSGGQGPGVGRCWMTQTTGAGGSTVLPTSGRRRGAGGLSGPRLGRKEGGASAGGLRTLPANPA